MNDSQNTLEHNRKKVGVYDRPAGADRARYVRLGVLVLAVGVSVFFAYFFFGQ